MSLAIALAVMVAASGAAPPTLALTSPARSQINDDVKDILSNKGYQFCNDRDHRLWPWERDYCPLLGTSNAACPEFPQVCKNELELTGDDELPTKPSSRMGNPDDAKDKDDRSKGKGDDEGKGDKEKEKEPEKLNLPEGVAFVLRILFFLFAAVFVGAIIWLIARSVMKGREGRETPKAPEDGAPAREPDDAARGLIEKDVDRLLARARAAAGRGDFKAAIDDAYAALLRRLEGDGLIQMHTSRTNGDYVRELRERPELREAVRDVVVDVERVQFGTEAPGPSLFEAVYRRVLPLVGRAAMLALVLLSLAPLASCNSVRRFAIKQEGGDGPLGMSAVATLLTQYDHAVTFRKNVPEEDKLDKQVVVLLPNTPIDATTWKRLMRWVRDDAGVLVIAGWREEVRDEFDVDLAVSPSRENVAPSPGAPWTRDVATLALPTLGTLVPADRLRKRIAPTSTVRSVLRRSTSQATYPEYAISIQDPGMVGQGTVVVFADDRWFANGALPFADNATFVVRFFNGLNREDIDVWSWADDDSGKGGAKTPMNSLANANLVPIVAQLFALILLFIFFRGVRFGTPREPRTISRRAFSDHARALGMNYARAKAVEHSNGLFAAWALDRLRERLQGTSRRGIAPLAEAIAQRTGEPIGAVTTTLLDATGARDEVAPPSSYRGGASSPPPAHSPSRRADFSIMNELDRFLSATKTKKRTERP